MKPTMAKTLLGYEFDWPDNKVSIIVSRLRQHKDSLYCEITVKTSLPSYQPHLHQANFNLTSSRAKIELINILHNRCEEADWEIIIEQLRIFTIRNYRTGEPVQTFSGESVPPPGFLLWPFVLEKQLLMIFGEGGVGKSLVACLMAACLQEEAAVPHVSLKKKSGGVLLLDYETDADVTSWRYGQLLRGIGLEGLPLHYRRCSIPIFDDESKIKEAIVETKADVVIIDSIGAACGNDLNDASTANTLALILRSFETTNIAITHTSKANGPRKMPYGSVYFYNNSRNIWEMKKSASIDEKNILNIGLFHRKSNTMRLQKPVGYSFEFLEDMVTVKSCDPKSMEEFQREFTLKERVLSVLKAQGKMTCQDIADSLDENEDSVRVTLYRLKKSAQVMKFDEDWVVLDKTKAIP